MGIRRIVGAGVVALLLGLVLPGPAAVGGRAGAQTSAAAVEPVRATKASEINPVASDSYIAWAHRPVGADRFVTFVKPDGGRRFRVNPRGTSALPGGIDGEMLAVREIRKNSNIRLFDLQAREYRPVPDQVNTRNKEWAPSISGRWLLFGRNEHTPGVPGRVSKIFLFDLETGEGRELAANARRLLIPGQVNGDWVIWHSCARSCTATRYQISERDRERIRLGQPAYSGSIDSSGTAYFGMSKPACGADVGFYSYPVGGPATLLFRLPRGVDILSSFAYDSGGATKVVFARIKCTKGQPGDVYRVDPSAVEQPPNVGPDIATGVGTVAYQIDVRHSGQLEDSTLQPPLRELWTTRLGDGISYPLVAEGKVFVTIRGEEAYGTSVYALDASTGTVLWFKDLAHTYNWSNAAYDDGKVFVVTYDGTAMALDADDGEELWSRQLGQYAYSSEPVAAGGIVYTAGSGSGGTITALDQSDGSVEWFVHLPSGADHSSPALSSDTMFVSYSGPQIYAFERESGDEVWHHAGCCSGGGGKTPVLNEGYLYSRADGYQVLDAETGEEVGRFEAQFAPAFSGSLGFFFNGSKLVAKEAPFGGVEWDFLGDGFLMGPAVVANGYVYMGASSGNLYALERNSGDVAWKTKLPWGIAGPDEHNVAVPVTGFGLGKGILLVPNGPNLTAFVNR